MGAVLDAWMLVPSWVHGESKPEEVSLTAVAERGYTDEDIDNILHGNWLRFFRRWLPEA